MYDIVESGKRIAGLRKNAGYTQEQFGEKIGLSYRSIADIERGYRGTSIDTLVDISNLLNVSLDYLVLGFEKHGEKRLYFGKEVFYECLCVWDTQRCVDNGIKYLAGFR